VDKLDAHVHFGTGDVQSNNRGLDLSKWAFKQLPCISAGSG
jgi:hypothetical protein